MGISPLHGLVGGGGGGGGGWGGCEGFRGEVESLWHVFEWKYMMYWFPCVN